MLRGIFENIRCTPIRIKQGMKILFLLLFVLCFLQSNVFATERQFIFYALDSYPFGFQDGNEMRGIMVDLMRALSKETGIDNVEIHLAPFARIVQDMKEGKADFAVLHSSPVMLEIANQVGLVAIEKTIAIGKKGTDLTTLEDLHGKTVCQIRNARYGDVYDSEDRINKYFVNNYSQYVQMLKKGRCFAVVGTAGYILETARKQGISKEEFGKPFVISEKKTFMHFSKKTYDAEVAAILKKALDKLRDAGIIRNFLNSYVEE